MILQYCEQNLCLAFFLSRKKTSTQNHEKTTTANLFLKELMWQFIKQLTSSVGLSLNMASSFLVYNLWIAFLGFPFLLCTFLI